MHQQFGIKRGKIQQAAIEKWPGNNFPNFRLPEVKKEMDDLALTLYKDCAMPEVNFELDGIKEHIKAVFNERRRSRKRLGTNYELPDKRRREGHSGSDDQIHLTSNKGSGSSNTTNKDKVSVVYESPITDESSDDNDVGRGNAGTLMTTKGKQPKQSYQWSDSKGKGAKMMHEPRIYDDDVCSTDSLTLPTKGKSSKLKASNKASGSSNTTNKDKVSVVYESPITDESSDDNDVGRGNAGTLMPIRKKAHVQSSEDDDIDDNLVLSSQLPTKKSEPESLRKFTVTTMMLSDKSAEVVVLCYTGKNTIEEVERKLLIALLKSLGVQLSLVKSLSIEQLIKVVAVKLINKHKVKVVTVGNDQPNFSKLKRSNVSKID